MLLKLSKSLLMNLAEEENLNFCQISLGLSVFCKNINRFKSLNIFTKSPVLDVWPVQNSHLTLINEKKALALFVKLTPEIASWYLLV